MSDRDLLVGGPAVKLLLADIKAHITGPAEALERSLLDSLASFSPRIAEAARPYRKMPDYHECTLELTPADRASFDAVIALVPEGWHLVLFDEDEGGECEAVWNPTPGQIFLLPEVTWAHILLVTPNPPAPDQEYMPL